MTSNVEIQLVENDEQDFGQIDPDELSLLSRIPFLAGSNKKAAYLALRSCGFPVKQALDFIDRTHATLTNWRKNDVIFKRIEDYHLEKLQKETSLEVTRLTFLRNLTLLMNKDLAVIAKGLGDLEQLSPRDYDYFRNIRRLYTPDQLLALEKAIAPERHKGEVIIHLNWGNNNNASVIESPQIKEITNGEFRELAGSDSP